MTIETFPNAPITEALIDFRAVLRPDDDFSKLRNFHEAVKARYPFSRQQVTLQQGIVFDQTGQARTSPAGKDVTALLFLSPDEKQIVQVRRNGFSFHRMRPYEHWDAFVAEAKDLWNHYCSVAEPVNVLRVAIRFLNRIELPLPIGDFRDYCLLFPQVPEGIPQLWSGFFMRVEHHDETTGASGTVVLTTEPGAQTTTLPIILDIDAFYNLRAPINPTDPSLWNRLNQLRELKNRIFFASLTDRAKALFR